MDRDAARRLSRRGFIGASAATAVTIGLAACAPNGSASVKGASGTLKFWDMQWGTGTPYANAARKVTNAYKPTAKNLGVTYQSVSWNGWLQTFTSAAASKTTPAVSSGASFLPFYFLEQGDTAPADDLISLLDKNGSNDYLPGLLPYMKTKNGYAGIPFSLGLMVLWMNTDLMEKAGAEVPTDWDSWITAGMALKKIGVVGFGTAAGSQSEDMAHVVEALLINNGGGFFDTEGHPDCVTDRNVETLDFINECVRKGILEPNVVSYTTDDMTRDWLSGHIGLGMTNNGLDKMFPAAQQSKIKVTDPIKGPHGDKGTIVGVNPLWMFKTTPSQSSSEEFLAYYVDQIHQYWSSGVETDLPAKKSIVELPAVQSNANNVKVINEWQPIAKSLAARAPAAFGALNTLDGGPQIFAMAQQIVEAKQSSKQILQTVQASLEKVVK